MSRLKIRPKLPALLVAALVGGLVVPAGAGDWANEKLQRLESTLEEGRSRQQSLEKRASELKREVTTLRERLIAAAASAQRREEAVSKLERRLAELTAQEEAKSAGLTRRRVELAATLGALQRLSLQPPEALIASPASAVDTLRSSLLLRAVVPELEAQAHALRRDLAALSHLRHDIIARKADLAAATQVLTKERRGLDRLLERKAALARRTEAESARERQRLARLSMQAEGLRALIAGLEAEPRAAEALGTSPDPAVPSTQLAAPRTAPTALPPEPNRPFSAARGTLSLPARGRVTSRFGQATEFGTPAKGITIETRPRAQVIAPYDGRVVFAGPFRGYGQLLIIDHGEGYHTLIAGFSRIDGIVGQWVLAGEPVGRMSQESGAKPELYVELRRNGEPINPLPWLIASEREVSG